MILRSLYVILHASLFPLVGKTKEVNYSYDFCYALPGSTTIIFEI
jgi:hypothetical protein